MTKQRLDEEAKPFTTPDEEEQIELAKMERSRLPKTDPTDEVAFKGETTGETDYEMPKKGPLNKRQPKP